MWPQHPSEVAAKEFKAFFNTITVGVAESIQSNAELANAQWVANTFSQKLLFNCFCNFDEQLSAPLWALTRNLWALNFKFWTSGPEVQMNLLGTERFSDRSNWKFSMQIVETFSPRKPKSSKELESHSSWISRELEKFKTFRSFKTQLRTIPKCSEIQFLNELPVDLEGANLVRNLSFEIQFWTSGGSLKQCGWTSSKCTKLLHSFQKSLIHFPENVHLN